MRRPYYACAIAGPTTAAGAQVYGPDVHLHMRQYRVELHPRAHPRGERAARHADEQPPAHVRAAQLHAQQLHLKLPEHCEWPAPLSVRSFVGLSVAGVNSTRSCRAESAGRTSRRCTSRISGTRWSLTRSSLTGDSSDQLYILLPSLSPLGKSRRL